MTNTKSRRRTPAPQRTTPLNRPARPAPPSQVNLDELEPDLDDDELDGDSGDDDGSDQDDDGYFDESQLPREYTAKTYTRGRLIPLPSGQSIRVQPFSLISALKRKNMPNHLVAAAREMIYGADDEIAKLRKRREAAQANKSASNKAADDGDRQADLMDYMVAKMITSFRVVEKAPDDCQEDEVSVEMIYEADKIAIVQFAMQGQKALEDFRQK